MSTTQRQPRTVDEPERYTQAVRIHHALWNPEMESVEYDGKTYRVTRRNEAKREFAIVDFDAGTRYVTQNLKKNSGWTRWALADERHRLTWIFSRNVGGGYSARIQSDAYETRVFLLNPDRLVYKVSHSQPLRREALKGVTDNVYPMHQQMGSPEPQ